MKKKYLAGLMMTVLSGSLIAKTLVTVNGTQIDSKEIDRQVHVLQQTKQATDSPDLRQKLVKRAIVRTIIAQEARRLKLDQTDEYKQASAQAMTQSKTSGINKQADFKAQWLDFEMQLLTQAYQKYVLQKNPPSQAEIQNVYTEWTNFYQGTQEVQLGRIITQEKSAADNAIQDLSNKKPFGDVARQYSIDPEVKTNGGMTEGYVPLKDLEKTNPKVYQAVYNLEKDQFTNPPISDGQTYAVFYVQDKRAVTVPSLNEAQDKIRDILQVQKLQSSVDGLYKKAKIVPAK